MRNFIILLCLVILPLQGFSEIGLPVAGKINDATIFMGLLSPSNYVANPIAWPNKSQTNPALYATQDRSTTSGYKIDGKSSWTCQTSAIIGYCAHKLRPLPDQFEGGYCQVFLTGKGDFSLYSIQVMDGATVKYTEKINRNFTSWSDFKSAIFPCSKDFNAIQITQTEAGTAPKVYYGLGFGKATGLAQYATASFFGGMEQVGIAGGACLFNENTSTGLADFKDLNTGSGCNAWTTSGGVAAVGVNDHRVVLNNMSPGQYKIEVVGLFQSTAQLCQWRLSDGTNTYQSQGSQFQPSGGVLGDGGSPGFNFSVTITSAQTSKTFKLQAADSSSFGCTLNNAYDGGNISWKVYYFPTSSQLAVNPNLPTGPTIQKFTSGSGTYTKPAGVTSIRVRMVGGGGGGGGSGTGGGANAGHGGNTTFGTSLLVANGGQGGATITTAASPGGTASLGTGPMGTAIQGGAGGAPTFVNTANFTSGGNGAASPFGGAGATQVNGAGLAAIANSGSGGGGAGTTATGAQYGGAGGGAGGFVDAIISSPLSTYSYAVGAAGAAGTAGTNGYAGTAGGSGYIEVTEYYQGMNAPILLGGVTTSGSDTAKVIYVTFNGSTGAKISGSTGVTTSRSAGGQYAVTVPAGVFSGPPSCSFNCSITGGQPRLPMLNGVSTATAVSPGCLNGSLTYADADTVEVTCTGPR